MKINRKWIAGLAAISLIIAGAVATARHGKAQTVKSTAHWFAPVGVAHGQSARICYFNPSQASTQVQVAFLDALTGKTLLQENQSVPPSSGFCSDFNAAGGVGGSPTGKHTEVVGYLDCNAEPMGPDVISLQIVENAIDRTVVIANPPVSVTAN